MFMRWKNINICSNKDYADGSSFLKNFIIRMWVHWCIKAIGTMAFMGIFFTAYFYLLKNPFFNIVSMPYTVVDEMVRFTPSFLYFYLSLWVYVSLVPALMESRSELFQYGLYIGVLCISGIGIYIVFPTMVPLIKINWSLYPDFTFLKTTDMSGNAFPSLHVATAFFTFFWLDRQLKQMGALSIVLGINIVWCTGIIYSTMAIKQHVFYDVLGGIALGGFFAFVTLKYHVKRLKVLV